MSDSYLITLIVMQPAFSTDPGEDSDPRGRYWPTHTWSCTFNRARALLTTPTSHMQSKRAKWFMTVLAVMLSLGGGPMAWAHLAGAAKCHESTPTTVQMAPDCPLHHLTKPSGDRHSPAPHTLPCCAGGSCVCGAPFSMPASASFVQTSAIVIESTSERPVAAAPSTIIDDTLRPPIS